MQRDSVFICVTIIQDLLCVLVLLNAYSFRHLVLSHFGLAFVLMLRLFSPELVVFSDFEFRTFIGTSILHLTIPVGWQLLLQLTVLSRSAIVV